MDTDEKLHAIALRLAEYFSPDAPVDIPALLFVAGLQVFGRPAAPLSREDKTALMHIGACAVLEPYGYYRMTGRDVQGYPQYESVRPLDASQAENGDLLKEALVKYFADCL